MTLDEARAEVEREVQKGRSRLGAIVGLYPSEEQRGPKWGPSEWFILLGEHWCQCEHSTGWAARLKDLLSPKASQRIQMMEPAERKAFEKLPGFFAVVPLEDGDACGYRWKPAEGMRPNLGNNSVVAVKICGDATEIIWFPNSLAVEPAPIDDD